MTSSTVHSLLRGWLLHIIRQRLPALEYPHQSMADAIQNRLVRKQSPQNKLQNAQPTVQPAPSLLPSSISLRCHNYLTMLDCQQRVGISLRDDPEYSWQILDSQLTVSEEICLNSVKQSDGRRVGGCNRAGWSSSIESLIGHFEQEI